jgi:hypothetical protein
MAAFISPRTRIARPEYWNNLAELQQVALSEGCTPAQFQNAVETMGTNPRHIANYLQRHAFSGDLDFKTGQAA